MTHEIARTNETKTNFTVSERECCSSPQPAHPIQAWPRTLIIVMTFLLGVTVIMDSSVLIGLG